MSWGATIDDGHGLFVVGTQQEEHAAEETEAQQPEHVQVNPEVEQIEPQHGRSTRQSTRPSYLEDYVLLADVDTKSTLRFEVACCKCRAEDKGWNELGVSQIWIDLVNEVADLSSRESYLGVL
ncbi:hypothetical protein F2Q70_00012916 [Brassica cretica]|uniref:Uncharacterized protein n=1 Tax=Brassica cretica TaxID=69181 RepID=A0A8S9M0W4_BRACR|nr:hypothetical protein F2Q70_00012916 [Brassica cretica]